MTPAATKAEVGAFWERTPCGTRGVAHEEGTRPFFDAIEARRDALEPFIQRFARFEAWRGKRVLEVGVGAGTDLVRFARAGAAVTGVDLTEHALRLARRRLELDGLAYELRQADAEALPFPDGSFDFVYSWGVIHHTPDPRAAAEEIVRVTRPSGGRVCVMVYHRHSLVALQAYVLHALLRGQPWRSLGDVIAGHIESPGTQAFSKDEARALFAPHLAEVTVTPVVTPYDLRIGRERFLPAFVQDLLPRRLGWFLVAEGTKR